MATRRCIDTHVHLWTLSDFEYDWPLPGMRIYRDYTIDEYKADRERLLKEKSVDIEGIVFVQVLAIEEETEKAIRLSKEDSIVKGIVGWVDLTSENVEERVTRLINESNGRLVGIRHIIDGESHDWLVTPSVKRGLRVLRDNNLTYDLLLRTHTLKHAVELAQEFPDLTFILDHIAKPRMNKTEFDEEWAKDLRESSKFENIFCKISGLVTETSDNWTVEQIQPYVVHAFNCFGWQRCIFGTDWPVFNEINKCQVTDVFEIVSSILRKHYSDEKNIEEILHAFFFENAIKVYKLKI